MENEASEQTLDHVLSHPFFAKKSSLQEKISTPKEGDGHDHSSETMNQYKGQHEKHGVDVTKSKPKKRPSESGIVDQQKNDVANDIDELVDEGRVGNSDQQHRALVATKAKFLMKQALKANKKQSRDWWNKQAKLADLADEFKIDESTKEYAKSLDKMANDRTLKMLSKSERENLKKIAKLLAKEEVELEEAQFSLSVGTSVAMKDKNKMLYGKVEKLEKVSGKPGVVVRWSNRQSGRFTMSSFAGLRMDKKADYIVSEEVAESCDCVGVVDAASNKAKKEANLFGTSPTANSRPKLRGKRVFRTLRQQNEKQVDGRTKAYRETYSRIMNRNKAKSNGEST